MRRTTAQAPRMRDSRVVPATRGVTCRLRTARSGRPKSSMFGSMLSNQAAALVGKLEGAKQWRAPALSGALQPDPRTRNDRFTLVAQLSDASADAPVAEQDASRATR